jgi:tagaturonate reductase
MSMPVTISNVKTPIIQFGTSRFLQAHADLFVSEALERGEAIGPITIVQTSGDASRRARLAALADPYPVQVQGLQDGAPVTREIRVRSVLRALAIEADYVEVRRIMIEEAEIVLSNTGDAGWRPLPGDTAEDFRPDMSFPAKLTHLLHARFRDGARPIQVMPTELVARNGDVLRGRVLELAARFGEPFVRWIDNDVLFVNSLVDRIVSEPLEPAGAIAEPYALWAIEKCDGLKLPCRHAAIQVVDALAPIERQKLHILNLGHTYLVQRWKEQAHGAAYVRDLIDDDDIRADLLDLYEREVVPVFDAAGLGDQARRYVATTIDRFANPYLDHRLADIAQNHAEKIRRRIGAFIDYGESLGLRLDQRRLRAVLAVAETP